MGPSQSTLRINYICLGKLRKYKRAFKYLEIFPGIGYLIPTEPKRSCLALPKPCNKKYILKNINRALLIRLDY